jgi:hypothetical protein
MMLHSPVQHANALVTTDWIKVPNELIKPLLDDLGEKGVLYFVTKKGQNDEHVVEYRLVGSSEIFVYQTIFTFNSIATSTFFLSTVSICPLVDLSQKGTSIG